MLPFTTEQFLGVFESYNRSVWPAQFVLFATALLLVVLAIWKRRFSDKVIGVGLAILWLWMGIAYQWLHFSAINPAAYLFGGAMSLQALLFLHAALVRSRLWFQARWNAYGIAGGVLLVYALAIYPLLGFLFGHNYPRSPTFGVPCPTTIFTFGMLLWTERLVPKYLLVIPFLWMLIGSSAAWLLGVWEDLGLLAAGFIAGTMILYRDRPKNKGKAA
jgi:hypothetical protein